MADQIIIELIGDPSGLKPAEDALKQLSKVSEENKEAFNKANEAFAKFTSSASAAAKAAKDFTDNSKDTGKALEGIGTSATKSITAISGLNGVIAAGTIKEVTKDYSSWSDKVKSLIQTKDDLIKKLTTESAKLKELTDNGIKSGVEYDKQRAVINKLTGTTGSLTTQLEKLGLTHSQVSNEAFRAGTAQKLLEAQTNGSGDAADKSGSKFKRMADGINEGGKLLNFSVIRKNSPPLWVRQVKL